MSKAAFKAYAALPSPECIISGQNLHAPKV
jgi:hypothetical protein